MKLYLITDNDETVLGCEYSKAAAIKVGKAYGTRFRVDLVIIDNPRDALRRLLGDSGGYASEIRTVYEEE